MAWTASIASKAVRGNGKLVVEVDYTNGTQVIREDINISNAQSDKWLKQQIIDRVNALKSLDTYSSTIQTGAVDLTPEPVTPPPTPTQAELDRAKWSEDYNRLQKLEALLSKKLIKANNAELLALQTSVEADFKPEYADLVI